MQTCSNYFTVHYLKPYLKVVKDCGNNPSGICKFEYKYLNSDDIMFFNHEHRRLILANGTMIDVAVYSAGNIINSRMQIHILTDNKNKIYTYGRDLFRVKLGGGTGENYLNKNKFLPYYYHPNVTDRNYYLKNNHHSCSKNKTGVMCLALILFDGWQMKDDYPW